MMKDNEKAKSIGISEYKKELNAKIKILNDLLNNYNDGRRKSFFSLAVNLMELNDVKYVMKQLKKDTKPEGISAKEKSLIAAKLFETTAKEKGIVLKLNK